ncbi:hypothetical protein MM300_02010 [Evansella sp. LMS18]|nr:MULTISPECIES: hypothetical protein [Evansella]UTR11128.1 hypothetical protein MM300_02010 [Evansella sp. LMS18]
MARVFFLLVGFGLAVLGGVSLVAYLNLLTVGFSLREYGLFLLTRPELYIFLSGLVLIWSIIYFPLRKK